VEMKHIAIGKKVIPLWVLLIVIIMIGVVVGVIILLFPKQPYPNITIYYGVKQAHITDEYCLSFLEPGNMFLEVNVTIKNNGYSSFNTMPQNFYLIADQFKRHVDVTTFYLGKWKTVELLDGETFNGILIFQVSQSATRFTLIYENPSAVYDIVWIKK